MGHSLYLGKLETIFPITLATSLIDKLLLSNRLWHAFVKPVILSLVSFTVILIELRVHPNIVIICDGTKTDLSG